MKEKRIRYFSYYGCSDPLRQRDNSPAADSKIDYIISAVNRCGYAVDLISCANSATGHFLHGYIEKKSNGNTLRYFSRLGNRSRMARAVNHFFMKFQFLLWGLFNLRRNEEVLVYHSLGYAGVFLILFKLKRLHIIGEIEEIYQDVHAQKKSYARDEYKFIGICDKFLFPTSLLNDKLNKEKKPFVIIHGVYSVEPSMADKFDDGKIHVVYGGTLDPKKGGAVAAVSAAEFLPENYHVHICGFGDPTQIKAVVADVSVRSKATVTFEGELKGEDYKKFIQKCHIGLSTQDPNAAFNATSFPSKILVYLSNGLKVVSIRIPAIEKSAVADNVIFYEIQSPQMIAQAIEKSVNSNIDGAKKLKKLDDKFSEDLNKLIE